MAEFLQRLHELGCCIVVRADESVGMVLSHHFANQAAIGRIAEHELALWRGVAESTRHAAHTVGAEWGLLKEMPD